MKYRIKNHQTGKVLFEAETTSLKSAVEEAVVNGKSLCARLQYASLRNANLRGANLQDANLQGANLQDVNFRDVNLRNTKGINPFFITPLLILLDQPGKIRAYKLVTEKFTGPYHSKLTYTIGEKYENKNADTDTTKQCARGINLATLDWCIKNWKTNYHILVAEFEAKDIAAIPIATDGKFRVFRCKIVGEKNLEDIGLLSQKETDHES